MLQGSPRSRQLTLFRRFSISACIAWSTVIIVSLVWNYLLLDRQAEELLHNQAVANFNKDQAFRNWATKHGGLYAPITEQTPPSPSMAHIPERDIETPSGKKLTLMNPAYMLRQLMEEYTELYDIKGKITGLVLLRPENAPDLWERDALLKLKGGAEEVVEHTEIDGVPHLRMMRPMYMLPGCDKCHGQLGFKTGDFRGGVSVSVPATPYVIARDKSFRVLAATHLMGWLFGLGGISLAGRQVRHHMAESQRAEEALRISEERYRTVIDTTNEGFSRIDNDLRMVEVNDALCQMLGYEREELLGRRPFELVDQASYPGLEERIRKSFGQGVEVNNREIRFKRKDGSILVALLSTNILFDEDGNPDGRFTFLSDITQKKERDAQLHQAQKMEAVGQLTGGVAHEFNNLLMVILGNVETLESRLEKDDPLQSFISSAMKGAVRGAELTQRLLAFSRKQRLQSGKVDLNGLVLGMKHLFQRTLGEIITIETDLTEDLWRTSADAGQIEAALLNFALNARDAMPDGGTITIRTSNRTMTAGTAAHFDRVEPGDYIALEVIDTGAGMTEEQIEHAFEPFYTTKEVGEGTGLGLSVAYGFAKQSGGCLEIESKPGQGTTVRLSLPRCSDQEVGAEREKILGTEQITSAGTILVVEDDPDVRALAVSQLTDMGYKVIEAEDGPAMLALLDQHSEIDLLFSDVVLPGGMSGPEAVKEAHREHPHLKVLFTSGYSEKDIENLQLDDKDVAILRKPYRKSELAEAIAAAMNPK